MERTAHQSMAIASALMSMLLLLAGCSGGGGGGGGSIPLPPGATETITESLTVRLADGSGNSVSTLTQGQSVHAEASVIETRTVSQEGRPDQVTRLPARGLVVSFATDGAALTPATGTALTDEAGIARLLVTAGGDAGAYVLTASVDANGGAEDEVAYEIATTFAPTLTLTLRDASGAATQRILAGTQGRIDVLAKRVEVDVDGEPTGNLIPAANNLITVGSDGGTFDPPNGTVLTDENGLASVPFQAALAVGGYELTASATIAGQEASNLFAYEVTAPDVRIGAGNPFVEGVVAVDQPQIGAGGQTAVRVRLVNADDSAYDVPLSVTFTSACAAAGNATVTSPVISSLGTAIATYVAGAFCTGNDTITASVLFPGQSLPASAQGTVQVAPPTAGSVQFLEADRSAIALRGRGTQTLPEVAHMTFLVLGGSGVPVPNEPVAFALSTTAGGLELSATQAVSDSSGQVHVQVQSGAVPTVFRVIASLPGTAVHTQSQQFTVSTGTPDQAGFSISASTLNPEAWNLDGVVETIQVRTSDIFRNPVPDGTIIQFRAEGGSVQPSCQTQNGGCSVEWTSQNPRPNDGRVTILATTSGDESFVDRDGDGVFSAGDSFTDLSEAFQDNNENGHFDSGEPWIDANGNGMHDGANGRYDGLLCDPGSGQCGSSGGIDVRARIVLVMATSAVSIRFVPTAVVVGVNGATQVRVEASDAHGNLPPAGTSISLETTVGELVGESSFTIGNSNARGPFAAIVTLEGEDAPTTGLLTATAQSPSGTTSYGYANVEVTDIAPTGAATGKVTRLAVSPATVRMGPGDARTMPISVWAMDAQDRAIGGVSAIVRCASSESGIATVMTPSVVTSASAGRPPIAQIHFAPSAPGMLHCEVASAGRVATINAEISP